MMPLPDYHLRFTFGYQIRFRSILSGIKLFKNIETICSIFGRVKIFEMGSCRASGRKS